MPIANCFVANDLNLADDNIVALWSAESGVSDDHMTVNVMQYHSQAGKRYRVMANLMLPDLWSKSDLEALQLGLATALAKGFRLPIEQVHVVTSIVHPGLVVEAGEVVKW